MLTFNFSDSVPGAAASSQRGSISHKTHPYARAQSQSPSGSSKVHLQHLQGHSGEAESIPPPSWHHPGVASHQQRADKAGVPAAKGEGV